MLKKNLNFKINYIKGSLLVGLYFFRLEWLEAAFIYHGTIVIS